MPLYEYSACQGCGQKVVKGAMRCTRCGTLLITPEEQLARVRMAVDAKKGSAVARFLKWTVFLAAVAGGAYYWERLRSIVNMLLGG